MFQAKKGKRRRGGEGKMGGTKREEKGGKKTGRYSHLAHTKKKGRKKRVVFTPRPRSAVGGGTTS